MLNYTLNRTFLHILSRIFKYFVATGLPGDLRHDSGEKRIPLVFSNFFLQKNSALSTGSNVTWSPTAQSM